PSRNDEYLLYQVLLGSFPVGTLEAGALDEYRSRILAYMTKACREAKWRTSWARVNEPYEAAVASFVDALLDGRPGNAFLEDLRAAVEPLAWAGYLNSLSMVTVKYTSPGVPDCYQGNELLDLSLVDPDNRRPVDYAVRRALLEELTALPDAPDDAALAAIFAASHDGRAKLFVMARLLRLRHAHEALFAHGGYTALRTSGQRARHAIAFARRRGKEAVVAVAPRLLAGIAGSPGKLPCGREVWGDTRVEIPFLGANAEVRDAITGRVQRVDGGGIALADLLDAAPVAVLLTT